jgi:hypothetical protein
MISDLDESLRQLLIAEMPVKNGEVEISFDQPKREWSSRLGKPTVNLFLYDVRENNVLRQHQWEQRSIGNGDNLAHLKRTPFRVDCYYMITTWAADPQDEHRLLTRALLALFRFPILPENRLVGSLSHPTFEIQAHLASHDKLNNPAEVWSSLDNEMRPSISYTITLALDPWKEVSGPIVSTLDLRALQTHLPPTVEEMVIIGGTLHSRVQPLQPLEGIEVAVKEGGKHATTDARGRFILGSFPPGEYTLLARAPDGKSRMKKISVPGKEGEYDLDL